MRSHPSSSQEKTTRPVPTQSAFTLVELLVAIAIIAILMALVISVGGKALDTAKAAKCAANLRQIGLAFSLLANENEARFPDRPIGTTPTWDTQIMPYLDTSGYDFLGIPSSSFLPTTVPLPVARIFKCPADAGPRLPANYARSYSITSWTCNYTNGYSANLPADVGIRIQQLVSPGKSAVLSECPVPAPIGGGMGNVLGSGNCARNAVRYTWSKIHRDRSNVLFADWHVELISKQNLSDQATLYKYDHPESATYVP